MWVVAESYIGVERSANYTPLDVGHTAVVVDYIAEAFGIYAYCQGVDSEVAAGEVIGKGAILDNRVPRLTSV